MGKCISILRTLTAVFTLVLIILTASNPAVARIKKMQLSTKPVKLINKFNSLDSSFPKNLSSDRDVFLVIYASATESDFYVLARPSVDPIQLAHKLDSAIKGTTLASEPVMYMQGEGYTWADAYVNRSQKWSRKAEMSHPVGLVISRLIQAGFKPHTLLCTLKTAKISNKLHLTGYSGKRWNVFKVNPNRTDLNCSLRSEISTKEVALAILMIFAIPIIGIVAFPVLIVIARSKRTTSAGRRGLFTGSYFWLMMICMAAYMTMFPAQLRSPWRRRMEDLWFGPSEGLIWFILPIMAPFALVALSKLVARFVFPVDTTESITNKPWYRRKSWISYIALFIILMATGDLDRLLPQASLIVRNHIYTMITFWFFLEHIYGRIMRSWTRLPGPRVPDESYFSRFSELARSFNLRFKRVDIVNNTRPPNGRHTLVKYLGDGTLLLGSQLVEKLSPEELDFVVAHEFAHTAQSHRAKAAAMLFSWIVLTLVPGLLFVTQPLNLSVLNWQIWSIAAGLALLAYDSIRLNKLREEEADRLALSRTRIAEAAVQAVMKTSGLFDAMSIKDIGKNSDTYKFDLLAPARLKWLKKAAEQMDLDAKSAFDKVEQDDALTSRAQAIAASMGVKLSKIEVVEPAMAKPLVNAAALNGGRILVGRALLDNFDSEEADFILAHELAHLKHRHIARKIVMLVIGLILIGVSLVLALPFSIPLYGYFVWIGFIGVSMFTGNLTWLSRRRELQADRTALRFTRNLPAAISALSKLYASNHIDIPEELEGYLSHPKEHYRVKSLRKEARKLGIQANEMEESTVA